MDSHLAFPKRRPAAGRSRRRSHDAKLKDNSPAVATNYYYVQTRMPASENNPPHRPRVPEPAPLVLGEPMRLDPLSWIQWAEKGMLLISLSLTRIAAR